MHTHNSGGMTLELEPRQEGSRTNTEHRTASCLAFQSRAGMGWRLVSRGKAGYPRNLGWDRGGGR